MRRQKFTASGLAALTRIDRRVVAQRLAGVAPCEVKRDRSGRETRRYWSDEALPAIFESSQLSARDARDLAAASKLEFELRRLKGEFIEIRVAEDAWRTAVSQIRDRTMGLLNERPELQDAVVGFLAEVARLPDVVVRGPGAAEEVDRD